MYGCSTVKEYEERLNEVAESMNIEHIAFLGGFDNVKQGVWDERLDDHLHRSPVFYPVEKPSKRWHLPRLLNILLTHRLHRSR